MSIIEQDKYDYSIFMDDVRNDFGLSDEELYVIRQSNEYVAFVFLNGRNSLKSKNHDKYEVFDLGEEVKEVEYRKNGKISTESIKFKKFMVVYTLNKSGKFPAIDLKEYVSELIQSGAMKPELLEFSLGYDVQNSSPIVMKLYGGQAEGFMPNYIGQPRSGKGINMRSIIYQLAMFPLSEFIIFDKGKDLLTIHNSKKTIFQMDIEDISSKPSRLINFFTYLSVYYQWKTEILNRFGYIDYKSYYRDFLRQAKEGLRDGEKRLPAIPYTIIIYDEIKRQRANFIEKHGGQGGDKIFDDLIGSFLNVAPFAGFKMIGATQEPNIASMGSGFKSLANIFFRIKYDVKDGITNMNSKILNSDSVKNARLMNYNDIWIKPPFASGGDTAINQYLAESMNSFSYLPEHHYYTVNELFQSLSVDGATSVILSSYKKIFTKLGFTEAEIEEIEASDEFFVYVVLAFYMYHTFSIEQLKPNLPIKNATKNFESPLDNTLFNSFMPLVSKEKEDTIRKVILGQINDKNDEWAEAFLTSFGNMMHGWYELEIKKSGISDLYGFGTEDIPQQKPKSQIPAQTIPTEQPVFTPPVITNPTIVQQDVPDPIYAPPVIIEETPSVVHVEESIAHSTPVITQNTPIATSPAISEPDLSFLDDISVDNIQVVSTTSSTIPVSPVEAVSPVVNEPVAVLGNNTVPGSTGIPKKPSDDPFDLN